MNKQNFEKRIKKQRPSFVFFNGHGTKESFLDNCGKEFLDLNSVSILKDTITFARSCDSLKKLGVKAVERGCKSFLGYRQKFWVARLHEMASRPMKDPVARPILEGSNIIAERLLKKKTVKEAVSASHEHATEVILELISSRDPYTSPTLAAIVHNDSSLGFEGDSLAKLG